MLEHWTSEEIFFSGDQFFERLIKDIDDAKSYITIEMYIFKDDALGRKVADQLIAAQVRGVKIQIVVDGIGSYDFFNQLHQRFKKNGIQVKMFNPLPFYHPYYGKLTLIRKIQVLGLRLLRINSRNHRKIITIDGNIMFTGSYNLTAEHTQLHIEAAWKDIGMRVTGKQVKFAILNFKRVWKLRDYYRYRRQIKSDKLPEWKDAPIRLNQTLIMRRYFYKNFLDRIDLSQKRIWLTTPYFIPKRRMIKLLARAAKRGVDVRILISFQTDVPIFRTLQYFYYEYLLKKGVKIFQYTNTILHAKSYIIDDWYTIGSSNLNHRSFMHDLEVDLIVQEEKNMRKIEQDFLESTQDSTPITMNLLNKRPLIDKILARLFFIFKYWF
jgi:cardiolipin synthase